MSPKYEEMAVVVRRYCDLIESAWEEDQGWLRELASILPRLHAAVACLGKSEADIGYFTAVDLDARFELFTQLHRLLGSHDAYWMEFDVEQDGQTMSGSLADDLTDIYCELKQGMALLEGNQSTRACDDWFSSYHSHWGQHLVDAERHLYGLRSRNVI
ncbi:MAG: DUF5063 domain-containing protein [Gammaproteobacteria bacterium]|nr:DUF5063 domain-containing protein [Gammaproteobacteria bacterium]